MRRTAAVWAGKATGALSRLSGRGGGTTLPGDVARAIGLLPKLVAQPADVDVDGPLQGIALDGPVQGVEQDLPGQHPAPGLHQCREKAELGCRKGNDSIAASQLESVQVDREIPVPNRAAILRPSRRGLGTA